MTNRVKHISGDLPTQTMRHVEGRTSGGLACWCGAPMVWGWSEPAEVWDADTITQRFFQECASGHIRWNRHVVLDRETVESFV